eukprot:9575459-Karenia_brevis.AAC.1
MVTHQQDMLFLKRVKHAAQWPTIQSISESRRLQVKVAQYQVMMIPTPTITRRTCHHSRVKHIAQPRSILMIAILVQMRVLLMTAKPKARAKVSSTGHLAKN